MPADSDPLVPEQIELIKKWIVAGAAFDGGKPTDPLHLVAPPATYPDPPANYSTPIAVTAVAFSPDGTQVVSSGYHELLCWNTSDGSLARRIKNIGQRVYAIAYSPDASRIAVACGTPGKSGEVRVVDWSSGNVILTSARTTDVHLDLAFSPDGTRLAVGGADGLIRIVEVATGNTLQTIASHADWVNAIAWSDDGKRLCSASRDKSAKVYTAENGELLTSYSGHGAAVRGVSFTADGNHVLSVGADNKIHRWEADGGKKIAEVPLSGEAYKLTRGPDFVISGASDKLLHRIDLTKNQESLKYTGHTDWVLSSATHLKNNQLISGSIDGELRLWNVADGTLLRTWRAAP